MASWMMTPYLGNGLLPKPMLTYYINNSTTFSAHCHNFLTLWEYVFHMWLAMWKKSRYVSLWKRNLAQCELTMITFSWQRLFFIIILFLVMKSGHNFAHVTTVQLSWHVQNCDLIGSLLFKYLATCIFARFVLWVHKLFVKWVSCVTKASVTTKMIQN